MSVEWWRMLTSKRNLILCGPSQHHGGANAVKRARLQWEAADAAIGKARWEDEEGAYRLGRMLDKIGYRGKVNDRRCLCTGRNGSWHW